jgi:hypothetical protein
LSLEDKATYNDHGIEQLLGQNTVPRYSTAHVELILGVFFLSFSNLLARKALVDAGAESLRRLLDCEEERVLGVLGRHGRWI